MSELASSLRHLRRNPSYVAAVVLSLSAGIAVCVAAFSLTNMLVFNTRPGINDRRGLLRINWTNGPGQWTTAEFESLEAGIPATLTGLAAQGDRLLPASLPSGPATLSTAFVSPGFFATLATQPLHGRLLDERDAAAAAPVAVISEDLWRSAFDASLDALGGALAIGGRTFTIVGVTPAAAPGLRVVDLSSPDSAYPQVWLCLGQAANWRTNPRPTDPWLAVAGRLSATASVAQARTQITALAKRISEAEPPIGIASARVRASVQVFRAGLDWRDDPGESLLVVGVFLMIPLGVLGIGCVNVANLQLARAIDQASELSLRLALGASPARLMALLTVEVAVLAGLSGAAGWLGARLLLDYARSFSPAPLVIDRSVLAFAVAMVTLVVAVAGILPAWLTSRDVVASGLRSLHHPSPLCGRLRGLLVVVQVAASLTLLASSGLAARSLAIRSPALPSAPQRILLADFDLANVRAADPRPSLFMNAVLDRLVHDPAITTAAFASFRMMAGGPVQYWGPDDGVRGPRAASGGFVTSSWFDATGATFLAGRRPQPSSTALPEAIVNAALASGLDAAGATVIGTELRVLDPIRHSRRAVMVVGVVSNTQPSSTGQAVPMLFLPMPAEAPAAMTLFAATRDTTAGRRAIEGAVAAADPIVPLGRVESLDVRIDEGSRGFRDIAWFALALGVVALGLAGAGLHSLLAYAVRRRTREIGIRVAIGANTTDVVWLVLKPGIWLVLVGSGLGLGAATAFAVVLRSALIGLSPFDLRALLPSVLLLFVVSLIASALPAYRAARVNPVQALRQE